ncbi:Transmembrane 4 L6 family member 4 [Acipenser ruthenus]|uniref:Transmembrane 4 L6 family member 4 n=1 Tax=Acipenser ruthenus TaxID=7906 RepID=A0A444TWY4_ACIRT|nr:Transmembrane 4 L6 family member 4 [Acipenser ruthenus]
MCSGSFAKCLGITLIPLAILCALANILLFFPGGKTVDKNENITEEVWYFGGLMGSGVLMIFPALVFLGLKNNDCCGCCGNESCGKRFAMFTSIIFAAVGLAGAGYSFIVSAVAIDRGPKCSTAEGYRYPFDNGYLSDPSVWRTCTEPANIVLWNWTLFTTLLALSGIEFILCLVQLINGMLVVLCGNYNCCKQSVEPA